MGTSSSSSGPGAGVSFDPPWLNSVALEIGEPSEQEPGEGPPDEQNPQQPEQIVRPIEVAPPRRFQAARTSLGKYINNGNRSSLKKALGNYSSKGMGGASNISNRMRVSTTAGVGLFSFLQNVRESTDLKIRDWVNQLSAKNLTASEIADEIINQVLPTGGSLDEESCKNSMAQALSDILTIDPEVDLTNMDNNIIWTVMELFIANEAFNRIYLDIGQAFESAKYSPSESVLRMNEMQDYLKSEISAQIQELRQETTDPSQAEINDLLQTAIKVTFEVFEEEI